MKTIVCGDRDWTDTGLVYGILSAIEIDCIIEGEARGADLIARAYAEYFGVPFIPHPANWSRFHRAAGPIRNREMLEENPEFVIAFHDSINSSKGTKDMVSIALKKGVDVFLVTHDTTELI